MNISEIKGNIRVNDFFIFSSCDSKYFDQYARPLYNSIKTNTTNIFHLHVINPTTEQLEYCEKNFSYSYEHVSDNDFLEATNRWQYAPDENSPEKFKYDRIIGAMAASNDVDIHERIKKTYFACIRFVRLAEILKKTNLSCFSIDVDAVVRKQIPMLEMDSAVSIHYIESKKKNGAIMPSSAKDRFLAGGIYIKGSHQGHAFIERYAKLLTDSIENNDIYWSLDQEMLKIAMEDVSYMQLPSTMIDFNMKPDGIVWTAKGKRKDIKIFQDELSKYSFS